MKSRIARAAIAAAACGALGVRGETTLAVPTDPASGVSIRLSLISPGPAHFGFSPVRVTIENGSDRDGAWSFHFESGILNQAPGMAAYDWPVRVPAHRDAELWAYVPTAVPGSGGGSPSIVGGAIVMPPTVTPGAVMLPMGGAGWTVVIRSNSAETVVTRTAPGGAMTIVDRIDAATGQRTTTTSHSGLFLSTSSSAGSRSPPPGRDITYTIDPATGDIRMTPHPMAGAKPRISIVQAAAPPIPPADPGTVVVSKLPTGTRVVRTQHLAGGGERVTQRDIDVRTGVITTTTLRDGAPVGSPRYSRAVPGGMTATLTIDLATGNVRRRLAGTPNPSAPPTVVIATGPPQDLLQINRSRASSGNTTITPSAARRASVGVGPSPGPLPGAMPYFASQALRLAATVSGTGIDTPTTETFPTTFARGGSMADMAATRPLEVEIRSALVGAIANPSLAVVDPAELPADWRVWSPFATVVLEKDRYDALDAARRSALDAWVGLGGDLVLIPAEQAQRQERRIGAGRILTAAQPLFDRPSLQDLADAGITLGPTPGQPDLSALSVDASPRAGLAEPAPDWNMDWVGIFLVAFAILVGPVNLLVFAPPAKRHRLFLTTPLLSVGGALVLCGAIAVQDGAGGRGRRLAVVVLMEGEHQALVVQEQASRTGFLTHRSFALGDDTALAALPFSDEGFRLNFLGNSEACFRQADLAYGDWFRSRARQAHELRRVVPSRARVEWIARGPAGAPVIESSVATRLRDFRYRDLSGRLWTAAAVEPGRRVTLSPATDDGPPAALAGTENLTRFWTNCGPVAQGHWSARGGPTDLAPIPTLAAIHWSDEIHYTGALVGVGEGPP